MEIDQSHVFQIDSDIVQKQYRENPNYLIEYSDNNNNYCTIYFCSHDIYFPNTESIFRKRIVEADYYEWYDTRIAASSKHIFVRDIFKQWYLAGINAEVNSPDKLYEFLHRETTGYKVITLGSSAGGYAAVLFGSLLKADHVIAFNPRFVISMLNGDDKKNAPLAIRLSDTPTSRFYDLRNWIDPQTNVYYFYSNKSSKDIQQYNYVCDLKSIRFISFSTSHHGIPFPKVCLPEMLQSNKDKFDRLTVKKHHPIFFSVRMVGWRKTICGLIQQTYKAYKKRK